MDDLQHVDRAQEDSQLELENHPQQNLQAAPSLPVLLRPVRPEDHPYIVDSWLISNRGSSIARDAGHAYVHDMKWLIRQWLERAAVLVAVDEDAQGAIWGWAATSGSTVLYVYVREQFRRQGIAKMLLAPFLARDGVIYCARPHREIPIPRGWRYSFLAGLRLLIPR